MRKNCRICAVNKYVTMKYYTYQSHSLCTYVCVQVCYNMSLLHLIIFVKSLNSKSNIQEVKYVATV